MRTSPLRLFLVSSVCAAGLGFILVEIILQNRIESASIPIHNEIYPYVMFRAPASDSWLSEDYSPSSRDPRKAVEFSNRDAFRIPSIDYEIPFEKNENEIRVAMLGGSTVRIGTTYEDSLPGVLHEKFKNHCQCHDITVINAGIISAISRQELIYLLTTVVDYHPDIVIVYDGINDSGQMLYYEDRLNFPYNFAAMETAWRNLINDRTDPIWRLLLSRSAIARVFRPDIFDIHSLTRPILPDDIIGNAELRLSFALAHVDNWYKMKIVAKAFGILPVFILQPTSLYPLFYPDRKPKEVDYLERLLYANFLIYEDMRAMTQVFAGENPDVIVLDFSSLLPFDAFFDGAHVYDEQNEIIATAIFNEIVELVDGVASRQQPSR